MQCNLLEEDVLYSFKVAYDPDFHKFSPGAQLESRALALFGDQGLTLEPTRVRDRRTSR